MVISGSTASHRSKAVAMLAKELKAPLHRVDLGSLVSQYIGETENNLNRVLDEAARRDAILFFDEADALLGKRSEVRDSHDRFVNLDAGALLDRFEQHEGLTILATNGRGQLDKRLQKYVHVPLGPGPKKKARAKKRRK
jgi:SpoVK/Ycf46/Vps4 family AAA+-type ATPase